MAYVIPRDEIEKALAEGDYDRAEVLVCEAANAFIAGQPVGGAPPENLEAWIDQVERAAGPRPWIIYYQAWMAFSSGQPGLAYLRLKEAAAAVARGVAQPPEGFAHADVRRWQAVVNASLATAAWVTGRGPEALEAFRSAAAVLGDGEHDRPSAVTADEARRWVAADPVGSASFWLAFGGVAEGLSITEALAAALNNVAQIAIDRGEPFAGQRIATASCELRRGQEGIAAYAVSLNSLGMAERATGAWAAADDDLLEARVLAQRAGHRQLASYALGNMAELAGDRRDGDAHVLFARSAAEKESIGDAYGLAYGWRAEARLLRLDGAFEAALDLARRARELRQTVTHPFEKASLVAELGACLIAAGQVDEGLGCLGEAEVAAASIDAKGVLASIYLQRGRLGDQAQAEIARSMIEQYRMVWLRAEDGPSRTPGVRVHLIGEFAIEVGGCALDVSGWKNRKAAEVLRLLALHGGRLVQSDSLLDAVWPDTHNARPSLKAALTTIRRALESAGGQRDLLVRDGERYALSVEWSDVGHFEAAVALAAAASAAGRMQLAGARYLEALQPWADATLLATDTYARWADDERRRLELVVHATRARAAALLLDLSVADQALEVGNQMVRTDPLDETGHQVVIRALLAMNDPGGARRAYESCERILEEQLGAAPSAATRSLMPN